MDNVQVYSVILNENIKNHSSLMNDIVQITPTENGENVYHITCTSVDTQGSYLSATVSSIPNGEPRTIQLSHAFVVAILEVVNIKNKPGFVG
jgi:hypothetical protein